MKNKTNNGLKIISFNRKASFNYFFNDLIEAGVVLKGSEIKSVREGKVNIAESYGVEKDGEIFLVNSHTHYIKLRVILIIIHILKENYYLTKKKLIN